MLLSPSSSHSFQKHFSTGRSLKRQRRGGKGTEKEWEGERSESYSGPAPASPLHWGLICLARCLCTLLLLVTFWCHGVTVKWLPSHVAARGGATSGTMRSRWVGAGTQEAPAGRNALTLPPSSAPMKSGISRSVADDKSVSVCPRLFPGPGEDPGWGETQTQATKGWELWGSPGATCMYSSDLWPKQRSNSVSAVALWESEWCLSAAGLAWLGTRGSVLTATLLFTVTSWWCIWTVKMFVHSEFGEKIGRIGYCLFCNFWSCFFLGQFFLKR